jgi:hypothetical protein
MKRKKRKGFRLRGLKAAAYLDWQRLRPAPRVCTLTARRPVPPMIDDAGVRQRVTTCDIKHVVVREENTLSLRLELSSSHPVPFERIPSRRTRNAATFIEDGSNRMVHRRLDNVAIAASAFQRCLGDLGGSVIREINRGPAPASPHPAASHQRELRPTA